MSMGATAPVTTATGAFTPAFQRELAHLFAWRRDVRRFKSDPLSEDLIARIIDAAGSAPSVGLSEPWRFVRVDSTATREKVIFNFEAENHSACLSQPSKRQDEYSKLKLAGLRESPTQIAVFCDAQTEQGGGLGVATMPQMKEYSVVCAVMQMWLAARALGVGMGWVSILDPVRLSHDLEVPHTWTLIAYLCLGWPEEDHLDCELERAGWETRRRTANRILTR